MLYIMTLYQVIQKSRTYECAILWCVSMN